ncbi:MAG: hypothetical protein NTY34_01885 [Candidatus Omnitrophica bacterium]|nr:hypothetical protein [Candidatus Omnitrophota bacterium]
MNYLELSHALRKYKIHLFTLEDVKNLFSNEKAKAIKNNLARWLTRGYVSRLRRNLYEFADKEETKISDLYVANRLYGPSYVSLETALSFYSIIPDIAAGVTSVTTGPTRTFRNKYGAFFYRTCRKKAFTGYRIIASEGSRIYIADKEKALVDFLYYRLRSGSYIDFDEERFNKKILRAIHWKKALKYAKVFNNKTLIVLKECKEYTLC